MAKFFAELKRRHVYRVAAAYVVVAWLILQVVNNVAPGLNLPNSAVTLVIVLLSAGFPIALIFAWIFDIKATEPANGVAPKAKTTGLDFVLIGGFVLVIAIFAFQQFAPSQATRTAQQQATGAPAATRPAGISIAVLPFVNLSDDRQQEFFSDGMTEEITSALAKVPKLQVVGRTSAFEFKGQNRDLRTIGQSLGATHLIEGSVRTAGDRVRVSAQLIQADSGLHLWTQNYDRQLTDIFAIQEDIALSIAGALRVPLGLQQGERLISNRAIDPGLYQQYLRAKALVRARGGRTALADAVTLLEQVVARNADYGPAWAQLALAYGVTPAFHPSWVNASIEELRRVVDATLPRAETAARRAIQLDPESPDGYLSLAFAQQIRGQFLSADGLYSKALALDSNNPEVLHLYSLLLSEVGRVKEALSMRQQLQLLDPFVPVFNGNTAVIQWLSGQTDTAIATLNDLPPGDAFRGYYLPRIYASAGRYAESADALREAPFAYLQGLREEAVQLLGTAPKHVASPQSLPRLGNVEFVYLHVGAPNRALEFYEDNLEIGYSLNIATSFLWHASYAPVRRSERFKAYARKLGLVDYWRAKGWPEFCRPSGTDDFVCD